MEQNQDVGQQTVDNFECHLTNDMIYNGSEEGSEQIDANHDNRKETVVKQEDNRLECDSIDDQIMNNNSDSTQTMSKRQIKRLMRNQKWLEAKPERRRREKEKKKLKRKKLKEEGIEQSRSERKNQLIPMIESKCKVKVCIDCDFSDFMNDNEIKKLVKQIGRCYAVNRHSSAPVQLYITSITGKVRDTFLKCQSGFVNWDAICLESHWSQVFDDKTKIIYLTSDSQDLIPDPKDICKTNDLVFIIGGLVDHNRHKGLCYRLAIEKDVRNGRLPIDQYIEMTQRRVLAVNHGMS